MIKQPLGRRALTEKVKTREIHLKLPEELFRQAAKEARKNFETITSFFTRTLMCYFKEKANGKEKRGEEEEGSKG